MALPYISRVILRNTSKIKQPFPASRHSLSIDSLIRARVQSMQYQHSVTSNLSEPYSSVLGRSMHGSEQNGTRNRANCWTYGIWSVMAFSLFGQTEEDTRDEAQKKEDEIILLLKKAKLSMKRGQLQVASGFLHQAIALAHKSHNTQAIIYTYSLMANLAYVQGQLDNAEKLFKAAMSFMLSGGTPQDDNAVVEMSLKLATIYAGQNKKELAEHGFQFCTESLKAKLEKKETSTEEQSEEQAEEAKKHRKETRLLLGLCLDSRARYMAVTQRPSQATRDYQSALKICQEEQGETHPQSIVLLSDLATILDQQGRYDEALPLVKKAVDLSRAAGHPDQHVLMGNMAGILLHQGHLDESVHLYKEALTLALSVGDEEAVEQILAGLKEVDKKSNEPKEAQE
ncbi:tetratricopeptide repeat protein 19, mitochondrial [Osmerus eperlanus]|uniref:tetratricopeptide repeat protein 19, mitochondrial n=1 Tax=Osmerus eperlanus TaxID=29151 RepID=UPI002E154D62